MTDSAPPGGDRDAHTRRSVLAGGVAGAAAAAGLAAPAAQGQVFPVDALYVLRERVPVNVRDRGAAADGRTDDTLAIQSAIDAVAAAGGGAVFLPAGDYVVGGGLRIAPGVPIRLFGAGRTRLIRTSGTATMVSAVGSAANRIALELSDLQLHGGGSAGMLADVQIANPAHLHRVVFSGATATGLRLRNVFNSTGSHLRFEACGAGLGAPACILDAVPGDGPQRGCDTIQWDDVQFEGNGGTDLKLTGDAARSPGSVANVVQIAQVKMEGGVAAASACPYIDLDYSQGCVFSNVQIGAHGGRSVTPVRKAHPFGGTDADKFVNLTIARAGDASIPFGVEHLGASLQLENVVVLGATTAAIKIGEGVGPGELQLGKLVTNAGRAVLDARTQVPTVAAAGTISPPRERLVVVTGAGAVTTVTPHEAGYVTTLVLAGGATMTPGGNLRLAGPFTAAAGATITLVSDGSRWHEVARSGR